MSNENAMDEEQQPPIQQPPRPQIIAAAAAAADAAQQQAHADELMNPSRQLDQSPLQTGGTSSDTTDKNSDSEDDDGLEDPSYLAQSFANNIFSSAESGFAIVIYKLLSNLEDDDTKATILNQVHIIAYLLLRKESHVNPFGLLVLGGKLYVYMGMLRLSHIARALPHRRRRGRGGV